MGRVVHALRSLSGREARDTLWGSVLRLQAFEAL